MTWLSPEATKARERASFRAKLWKPTLKRTQDQLALFHAVNNRRGQRQHTRTTMEGLGWVWDAKVGCFHADLTAENLTVVLEAWTNQWGTYLNVSKGVRDFQDTGEKDGDQR